jgi:ABC-type lipoprotein export system ATPase subunit
MSEASPVLKLSNVTKQYDGVDGAAALPILREIDLELGRGESVAIIGPSGSGKSTLLNIMGTLDRPSSGQVWIEGEEMSGLDEEQLANTRNRRIGFIFQGHHLLPQCTVMENVLVPTLASKGTPRDGVQARANRLLERVGLGARVSHRPGQLSGGERQRVAVVRALINQPKLLLADEPTGALDRASAGQLGELLVELNREEGVTLVVVTHALDLARRMNRVLELRNGKLESPS